MRELEYPFNSELIMKKKIKLQKELLTDSSNGFTDKNIAILGGATTKDIKLILELFLLNQGIRPTFYESEYNQFYQDAIFGNQELDSFKPDIIYICTSNRNVIAMPSITDSIKDICEKLQSEYSRYEMVWNSLIQKFNCPIIQNNFEMPFYRLLGNKDVADVHGHTNFLNQLNQKVYEYAQNHENFYVCDINYLSADYGLKDWSNPFYYHMYKYAVNINAIPILAFNVANIIKSIFGKNKKALAIDLDNTLWGGIVGDDGVENLELGQETSVGQAYCEFQTYLKELSYQGILLNIVSKNDEQNALDGLEHPQMILKKDDFVSIKANWLPKNQNLANMAKELNLLPESFVFVDDNPAEREIVGKEFPNVGLPQLQSVENYILDIDRAGYFETTILSNDDLKRTEMYKENVKRIEQQNSFVDYNDYLLSLEMTADIKPFENIYMSRIAQLTNKSNQFNLTTKRYTQDEIEHIAQDNQYVTMYGKLVDKFGDNGVVTVVIGQINDSALDIILWLMSCRVLKRDMEFAMMDELVKKAKSLNVGKINGYYYPTLKNGMVKDFYAQHGFIKVSEDKEGNTKWTLSIEKYKNKNKAIKVN